MSLNLGRGRLKPSFQQRTEQSLLCKLGYLNARNACAEVWANVMSGDVGVEETRLLNVSSINMV